MLSLFLCEAMVEADGLIFGTISSRWVCRLFSTEGMGGTGGMAFALEVSLAVALRLARRGDLGRLVVMLALVALIKLELATLRRDVGRARRIFWE